MIPAEGLAGTAAAIDDCHPGREIIKVKPVRARLRKSCSAGDLLLKHLTEFYIRQGVTERGLRKRECRDPFPLTNFVRVRVVLAHLIHERARQNKIEKSIDRIDEIF